MFGVFMGCSKSPSEGRQYTTWKTTSSPAAATLPSVPSSVEVKVASPPNLGFYNGIEVSCPPTAQSASSTPFNQPALSRALGAIQRDCHTTGPGGIGWIEISFEGSGALSDLRLSGYDPRAVACIRPKLLMVTVPPFDSACAAARVLLNLTL